MSRFYKLFIRTRTVFYVVSFILVTAFSGNAQAAANSVFTIEGVTVDITADSAAAAREQAFAQAQNTAFRQLADRLLSDDQLNYFQMPEPSVISTMVKDYEITQEQLSKVRYIGTYTFRFQSDAVRNYLGSRGFAYTDVSSKPVLVLPFYQRGAQTVLWGDDNPWMKAWANTQTFEGLVPVIIPIGDVQDVSDIGDAEALTYTPDNLADMTQRYHAGETIIMVAIPEWTGGTHEDSQLPDKLTVMVYRTDHGSPEFANRLTITKDTLDGAADVFAAAVTQSRKNLQQAWKSQTMTSAAQSNMVKVRVKFDTMKEWIETQKKLRRVQGVNDMKLLSLTQNEANVELQFQGTEDRLRLALAQADMTLSSPQVSFNGTNNDPYNYYNQRTAAPLVYDLYMNKYYHPNQ